MVNRKHFSDLNTMSIGHETADHTVPPHCGVDHPTMSRSIPFGSFKLPILVHRRRKDACKWGSRL
jgi:hypothetical protein